MTKDKGTPIETGLTLTRGQFLSMFFFFIELVGNKLENGLTLIKL